MYCRNCGKEMENVAAVCVNCGVPAGQGTNFCPNCGAPTAPGAFACTNCGVGLAQPVPVGEQKSKLAAGLLGIFLGGLGVHNFYLGYKTKAIIQLVLTLCTCGLAGPISSIWGLVEGIMVLTGSIDVDGNGVPLKD